MILDAAHNPAGAMVLAAHLRQIGWNGITAVVGVMRDKDVTGMLDALLPCCASLICTTPPSPRALPAASLAAIAKGRAHASCRNSQHRLTGDGDAPCVPAGSACRRRRIDLSDRSPAWYSSLIRPRLRAVFRVLHRRASMPAGVAASSTYCMHRRILLPVVLAFLASLDVPGLLGISIARARRWRRRERSDAAARSRSAAAPSVAATCAEAAGAAAPAAPAQARKARSRGVSFPR